MAGLTPESRELFEKPNIAHLATVSPRGWPQVSPVWVDLEGDLIRVNSARGRVKVANMERDPRVALSVADAEDPYRKVVVQGRVVEVTEEGALEHIDLLARKYLGRERYPWLQPGMVRVLFRIRPERVAR